MYDNDASSWTQSEDESDVEENLTSDTDHNDLSLFETNRTPVPYIYKGGWDEHFLPTFRFKPNTVLLKKSEFYFTTQLTSGLCETKKQRTPSNISSILRMRENGSFPYTGFSYGNRNKITNRFTPNTMLTFDLCNGKVYNGIFTKDGNYFITTSQDKKIRLYQSGIGPYVLLNTIRGQDICWNIIDIAFSPDNNYFVYSTWMPYLHLCSVTDTTKQQEPLCLSNTEQQFCVFSVKFSSDSRELLAGTNDGCLYIYDRQRNSLSLKSRAHGYYDVNCVQFADDSSQIIYSGGDDGLLKVWDRRSLSEMFPKPVGVLAGHMNGITFIDSKGDGRHLLSNSKDQTIKLWDVRVFSTEKAAERSFKATHGQQWDYRWQQVPKKLFASNTKLEGDTSIMTFRGHTVVKTLIRSRFSPAETTGQRYIYTGSGTGVIIVFDCLTGSIKTTLNGHSGCVRDVAWHPFRNELLSSSWDGRIGYWTYSGADSEDYELCSKNSEKTQPRRCLRVALKKIKIQIN